MLQSFQNHIGQNLNALGGKKILIAISGGLDSVMLTHLCHQSHLNISLAHCNFNLRGSESDADEAFVLQLAEDLGLEVFVESFNTENFANSEKLSTQMAARQLRYDWFEDLATRLGFDYILTAHHADDNLETFLINLSRGSGLDGLKGIPEINGKCVRPLLPWSREDIETYAKNENLKWREDSSNKMTKYLRNKIRHDVIPHLKSIEPQFLSNFQKSISHLNQASELVNDSLSTFLITAITKKDDEEIRFDIAAFQKTTEPKAYLFQCFKDYGFTEWDSIYELLEAQSGKQIFSKTHRLIKNRGELILTAIKDSQDIEAQAHVFIPTLVETINIQRGKLRFEETLEKHPKDSSAIYVDAEMLKFPLIIRHWEKGDYFYPFGMQGKKKLSKFFKDEKLSLHDKEKCLLLCCQNEIVWVINYRMDNRFRVTTQTNKILKISIE